MRIIKQSKGTTKEAVQILENGGVVVIATETIYGLHANPISKKAVDKIFAIKKRNSNMPLALVAGSTDIVKKYFILNELEQKLVDKFWPGPIGLSLRANNNPVTQVIFKNSLGERHNTLKPVVRVTSNLIAARISKELNLPIISTSANISGCPACYDVECIKEQFEGSDVVPDLIIDSGKLPQGPASTMLDLTGDELQVIREGAEFDEIQKFLKTC